MSKVALDESPGTEAFSPGVATAMVVVQGAVFGLLGFRQGAMIGTNNTMASIDCIYRMIDNTTGAIHIPLLRETPRTLNLVRLREELEFFRTTLQKIIDRTIAEGMDIQVYSADNPDSKGAITKLYIVENFTVGMTSKFNTLYSRSNALSSVMLNQVRVDLDSSAIYLEFYIMEAPEAKRFADTAQANQENPISRMIESFAAPRIFCFEGHALYDRLQRDWWRLPMMHFWITLAAVYSLFTASFVVGDFNESKPRLELRLDWITLLLVGGLLSVAIPLEKYFRRVGVFERLRVGTVHLRGQLDHDATKVALLTAACFVPFLQSTGQWLIADAESAFFLPKCTFAFMLFMIYPALSYMSSIFLGITIAENLHHVIFTMWTWSGRDADLFPQYQGRDVMLLTRRIVILVLALTVFAWYFMLGSDGTHPSAYWSTVWTEAVLAPVILELGLLATALVLGTLVGILLAFFCVTFLVLRGLQMQFRLRLPH